MNSSRISAIALSIVCFLGYTSPVFAQLSSGAESIDEVITPRSKIVDVDIVTNSPTLGQTAPQQTQLTSDPSYGMSDGAGTTQFGSATQLSEAGAAPPGSSQKTGVVQQNSFPSQNASVGLNSSGFQNTAQQPIQIDTQTVGRVVGVAGTALMLGAFLRNGGVGAMMNTFGLDNRFHSRGSSLAPY